MYDMCTCMTCVHVWHVSNRTGTRFFKDQCMSSDLNWVPPDHWGGRRADGVQVLPVGNRYLGAGETAAATQPKNHYRRHWEDQQNIHQRWRHLHPFLPLWEILRKSTCKCDTKIDVNWLFQSNDISNVYMECGPTWQLGWWWIKALNVARAEWPCPNWQYFKF